MNHYARLPPIIHYVFNFRLGSRLWLRHTNNYTSHLPTNPPHRQWTAFITQFPIQITNHESVSWKQLSLSSICSILLPIGELHELVRKWFIIPFKRRYHMRGERNLVQNVGGQLPKLICVTSCPLTDRWRCQVTTKEKEILSLKLISRC